MSYPNTPTNAPNPQNLEIANIGNTTLGTNENEGLQQAISIVKNNTVLKNIANNIAGLNSNTKQELQNLTSAAPGVIEDLKNKFISKLESEKLDVWKTRYKNMLERKFGPIPEPLPVKRTPDFYPYTSELFIGELVQAVKRSLMKGNIDLLELHDINELMYVAIHEVSHIGCPENGHTKLFAKINLFLLQRAVELGLYNYRDYSANPVEYCGMILTTSILG